MRTVALGGLLSFVVSLVPAPTRAQTSVAPAAPPRLQQRHDEDGGVRETLESIVISPMAHSPFTATLETEWVRTLSTGGTITLVNQRRIARDSSGRVYQERWLLVPKNGTRESQLSAIQISDPNRHVLFTCMMLDGQHVCHETFYAPSTSTAVKFEGPPTGPLPNNAGDAMHEELGKQQLAGMETVGTRDSTTYNPGVFGNDSAITVEREYWFSQQLGINLLSKRIDPRFGTQTFTINEISISEPEAQLFDLPKGFTVVDHRGKVAGAGH
jgi:hypothetical protein